MSSRTFLFLMLSFAFVVSSLSAQVDFSNDPEKATVYFVRTSSVGAAINFKFFANEEYLGKCNYGKYLKVELEPGAYVLWAKADNIDFVEANLVAGESYIINAVPSMGGVKSGVRLKPVSPDDGKKADRAVRYLLKKPLVSFSKEELAMEALKWEDLVKKGMDRYQNKKLGNKVFTQLSEPFDLSKLASPQGESSGGDGRR